MCFICVIGGGPGYFHGVSFATFVSVFGFSISLIFLLLYLFHVVDQYQHLPIIVTEMIYCFAWTIFFFIAGSVLAVASVTFKGAAFWAVAAVGIFVINPGNFHRAWGIFVFFGFGAMCVYGLDCYLKFLAWKNNETARGGSNTYYTPRSQNI
ncbi:hypothetical protein FO519_005043 [Halicephalobus sp. NKZ332]|nr:hypothetical protein FO519_005043 [Halicephalobus sp. NKZ332]